MQSVAALIKGYERILRFIVAGGTGTVVNLVALYILVHYFLWHPVLASVGSFVCAFFVSFTLQKLWTYRNYNKKTAGQQMLGYLGIQLINLGFNTVIMYGFITYTPIHYLLAQILTSAIIAVESFFVYKHIVFKDVRESDEAAA